MKIYDIINNKMPVYVLSVNGAPVIASENPAELKLYAEQISDPDAVIKIDQVSKEKPEIEARKREDKYSVTVDGFPILTSDDPEYIFDVYSHAKMNNPKANIRMVEKNA